MAAQEVKQDVIKLIEALARGWANNPDFAPGGVCHDPDDGEDPTPLVLHVATENGRQWSYQTGDSSFFGACYGMPHWATVHVTNKECPHETLASILDQWDESMAW